MTSARASNRNQPPNLHDLIAGKAEEVANMDRIALHDREESLLPSGKASAVLTPDHRLVAEVVSDIVEVDRASQRFASY